MYFKTFNRFVRRRIVSYSCPKPKCLTIGQRCLHDYACISELYILQWVNTGPKAGSTHWLPGNWNEILNINNLQTN